MKDNDILYAMQCCSSDSPFKCDGCPLKRRNKCTKMLFDGLKRIIIKQQAEIDRLTKYNTDVAFRHYNDGIKDFAEELKRKAEPFNMVIGAGAIRIEKAVSVRAIDNIAKEMVVNESDG